MDSHNSSSITGTIKSESAIFKTAPLTLLQPAVVPGQACVWVGVAPGSMLVFVWVPAEVLLKPYMGYCRV